MINTILLILVFYFSLLSLSCSTSQTPAPLTKESEAKTMEKAVPQEGYERDWQKTLAAAKGEGKLNIYGTQGSEVRRAFSQAFKDKFGLDIEWTIARESELPPKLFRERGAGIYLADVFLSGSNTPINDLKPAGILEPIKPLLVLPEVLDEKAWYGGLIPWVDKEKSYIISSMLLPGGALVLNTNMVKPEEVSSYNNLLEPRWKGKIAIEDPTVAGRGARQFSALLVIMGPDFWRKFVGNSPVVIRDPRLPVEWVAHGKYPMAMGVAADIFMEFVRAGAPLKKWTLREGGFLIGSPNAISFINRAPHPNAAKVFINWHLSKEGTTFYSRLNNVQSAREDVPTDHLSPDDMRDPSFKYFNTVIEEFLLKQAANRKLAEEIFGPLLK